MSRSGRLGHEGEEIAARHLRDLGYTIVTRRYRARHGEIDIVALDGDVLVFVEVKTRTRGDLAELAIDERKRAALVRAAQAYRSEMGETNREARFDVVAVQGAELRHHQAVF